MKQYGPLQLPNACRTTLATALAVSGICAADAWSADPSTGASSGPAPAARTVDYSTQLRPLFAKRCTGCHGGRQQKGGLRLDSPAGIEEGSDSGPIVEPGKSAESRLYELITGADPKRIMPPEGERLSESEISLIRDWIDSGAKLPQQLGPDSPFVEDDKTYWAFQPIQRPPLPSVRATERITASIDRFLLAKLESVGLSFAHQADRRTLIRRATFDLLGMPPTAVEISAFANDSAPDAYERLIDRLLASPRYGERWARHWLDLVRYAESDGFKADDIRPNAWRYRDYVINSLNADKSYGRFVAEQIAGDELSPTNPDALVATGFLRHWPYEYNQAHVRQQWENILNDITDVTGQAFLGLTIQCARCHDHKFDPILQRDYYRLQAFFAPLLPIDLPIGEDVFDSAKLHQWESATREVRRQITEMESDIRARFRAERMGRFPKDIQAMFKTPIGERTALERQLTELAEKQLGATTKEVSEKMKKDVRRRWDALNAELAKQAVLPPAAAPAAMAVRDVGREAPATVIQGVADAARVEPGFLSLLDPAPARIETSKIDAGTGRRTALAKWLVAEDNPLTARVLVNRLWHYHFGQGLVGTPSDFGRRGDPPSHPELLDWLASELLRRDGSLKAMHRLIVTSTAYRQGSVFARYNDDSDREYLARARLVDPENRLLWRMRVRRLTGEELHDAMLAVGDELNLKMGGPSVRPQIPSEAGEGTAWAPTTDTYESNRRAIYVFVKRNLPFPLFDAFDMPDTHESCACRNVTTTSPQALLLFNGAWTHDRATAMAREAESGADSNVATHVRRAYQLALGRMPDTQELARTLHFLDTARDDGRSAQRGVQTATKPAIAELCHVLLNTNEFLYVD